MMLAKLKISRRYDDSHPYEFAIERVGDLVVLRRIGRGVEQAHVAAKEVADLSMPISVTVNGRSVEVDEEEIRIEVEAP